MLTIHLSTRFKRSYKKTPAKIKNDFAKRIKIFQKDPFQLNLNTHKLKGKLDDYYSFYLQGGYRVLFDFVGDNTVILVNIGSHNDYKKWAS